MATNVSIFGAPCIIPLKPLVKKVLFMYIMAPASIISMMPIIAAVSPSASPASPAPGHPHMVKPMEKYMSTRSRATEMIRRFLSFGVSVSLRISSAASALLRRAP